MASAAGTTTERLRRSLESSGWTVEIQPSELGVTGLATREDDDGDGLLRLSAWGRDAGSVVLLLFEQACARMLPHERPSG